MLAYPFEKVIGRLRFLLANGLKFNNKSNEELNKIIFRF